MEAAAARRVQRAGHLTGEDDLLVAVVRVEGRAAANSALVYGCSGLADSSSLSPTSTILPRYITAMRWLMWVTVARSWPMNR